MSYTFNFRRILFAFILILALAACGGSETPTEEAIEPAEDVTTDVVEETDNQPEEEGTETESQEEEEVEVVETEMSMSLTEDDVIGSYTFDNPDNRCIIMRSLCIANVTFRVTG